MGVEPMPRALRDSHAEFVPQPPLRGRGGGDAPGEGAQAWSVATRLCPRAQKVCTWIEALGQLDLQSVTLRADDSFEGSVTRVLSPHDSEYVHMASCRQEFAATRQWRTSAFILLVLRGEGAATGPDGERLVLGPGNLFFGQVPARTRFDFVTDFELLAIRMPSRQLSGRLPAPLPRRLERLPGSSDFSRIFAQMLEACASRLTGLNTEQLRAIENTVTEFLFTSVMSEGEDSQKGGRQGRQAVLTAKVLQSVEQHLAEPDLNQGLIAREHGLHVRTLQKLFKSLETTFSAHVRVRRLERCREELESPLTRHLSISEIGYHWGFPDPAYFSRAFRSHFGQSPREFRRSVTGSPD